MIVMAVQRIRDRRSPATPQHPGAVFKNGVLRALDLSVSEAARRLRVSRQTLHRILAGKNAVTPEMALRLGRFCGSGPYFWLRLQHNYDLWSTERSLGDELDKIEAGAEAERSTDVDAGELRPAGPSIDSEAAGDEIGRLYDEIADLTAKLDELPDEGGEPIARALLEARIDAAYVELRRLQHEEAERYRRSFASSLELPIDAGSRVLDEARALRRALEAVASPPAVAAEAVAAATPPEPPAAESEAESAAEKAPAAVQPSTEPGA
ncbi:MAG: addiction module antidote protein, HigA family [Acidobacteria bacterium]|nr:MAG: addiction module antidote protein, HigA family [Acidobacteriota bacterium]